MEAIKRAVEVGLGAAFMSRAAVQNELQLGLLSAVEIEAHLPILAFVLCAHAAMRCCRSRVLTASVPCVSPLLLTSDAALRSRRCALMHLGQPAAEQPDLLAMASHLVNFPVGMGLQGVPLRRCLNCVTDPVRYCSHAVRAFIREMFGLTVQTSPIGCLLPGQARPLLSTSATLPVNHDVTAFLWRRQVYCTKVYLRPAARRGDHRSTRHLSRPLRACIVPGAPAVTKPVCC